MKKPVIEDFYDVYDPRGMSSTEYQNYRTAFDKWAKNVKNTKTKTATIEEIVKDESICPFPIGIIPDNMGINLCSVDSITWTKQEDGQLIDLIINFIPNNE